MVGEPLMRAQTTRRSNQLMSMHRRNATCLIGLAVASLAMDRLSAQSEQPLQLEHKIPLGDVNGRIDHMAIDLPRRRLFVAELGNDSVAVVDINERKVQHVITGLKQ